MTIVDTGKFSGYIAFNNYNIQITVLPDGKMLIKLEFISVGNDMEFDNCVVFSNNEILEKYKTVNADNLCVTNNQVGQQSIVKMKRKTI